MYMYIINVAIISTLNQLAIIVTEVLKQAQKTIKNGNRFHVKLSDTNVSGAI